MKRRTLLSPEQAADRLGITPEQLRRLHDAGKGPTYLEPSPRTIRYLPEDLDAWTEDPNQ